MSLCHYYIYIPIRIDIRIFYFYKHALIEFEKNYGPLSKRGTSGINDADIIPKIIKLSYCKIY